jgi:hypothetical protein
MVVALKDVGRAGGAREERRGVLGGVCEEPWRFGCSRRRTLA